MTAPPAAANRAAAVRGWLAGGSVYSSAVLNRSALGIAAIAAAHRFGISPAQLSVFVMLQLGVYAAMQVPTGMLVDTFGSRRLLLAASSVIGIAGALFAFAPNYPTALLARGLLGCGDAMTYISVLRFAGSSFSPRRFPHVIALTGLFGLGAAILATAPLSLLLHAAGWRVTFSITALAPVVAGILVWFAMAPAAAAPASQISGRERAGEMLSSARTAWRTAGTRLGFWVHFSTMSTATVFGVLWGLPYLVSAGFGTAAASELLLLSVVVSLVASFTLSAVVAARPYVRVPLAIGSCVTTLLSWGLLLGLGGTHPNQAWVTVLVAVMALGPPVSAVAFMLARDYNRPAIGGTATGVVNCAGFLATIVCAAVIGGVLEIVGNSGPDAFRVALAAAFGIQAIGTYRAVVWWHRVRAEVLRKQADGLATPVRLVPRVWDAPDVRVGAAVRASGRPQPDPGGY